jgi:hypothetical protein
VTVLSVSLTSPWLVLAVLLGAAQQGQPQAGEAKRVKVTVVAILANDYWDVVEPQLKPLAEEIRKKHPSLRGFTIASLESRSLAVNEKTRFPLVEDANLEIVIHQPADKANVVTLSVWPPKQKEIVYRSVCGKFLPIITLHQTQECIPPPAVVLTLALLQCRQPTAHLAAASLLARCRSREYLILAIRVQPCNGK